jgi:hypothetical protein
MLFQPFEFRPRRQAVFVLRSDMVVPDYLSHYYEFSKGPFLSLSRLSLDEAERVMDRICEGCGTMSRSGHF